MSQKVLVVEDEVDVRELVSLHLKRAGHSVTSVSSVEEARGALKASSFDTIVLDWMLPGASGIDFAREVRRTPGDIGILMLTAKSEPRDIVEGLEAGADDFLTKPFDSSVLIARIRALARRVRSVEAPPVTGSSRVAESSAALSMDIVRLGGLSLNVGTYEVKCCEEPIALTPSEFKLMLALARSKGRVLTRDSLISQVQGDGVSVVGRTVDTHVFGLRRKLGSCADVIETVRGVGYRVKSEMDA